MSGKRKVLLSLSTIILLSLFSNQVSAASCDPSVAKNVLDAQKKQVNATFNGTPTKDIGNGKGEEDLLGCTNVWPTADFGFSLPNISDILKKIGEEAMNKACDAARDAIREQVNKAQANLSVNASDIKGFDELGISDINLGSAGLDTGLGNSSSVTVNGKGSRSNWDNITSNFK